VGGGGGEVRWGVGFLARCPGGRRKSKAKIWPFNSRLPGLVEGEERERERNYFVNLPHRLPLPAIGGKGEGRKKKKTLAGKKRGRRRRLLAMLLILEQDNLPSAGGEGGEKNRFGWNLGVSSSNSRTPPPPPPTTQKKKNNQFLLLAWWAHKKVGGKEGGRESVDGEEASLLCSFLVRAHREKKGGVGRFFSS